MRTPAVATVVLLLGLTGIFGCQCEFEQEDNGSIAAALAKNAWEYDGREFTGMGKVDLMADAIDTWVVRPAPGVSGPQQFLVMSPSARPMSVFVLSCPTGSESVGPYQVVTQVTLGPNDAGDRYQGALPPFEAGTSYVVQIWADSRPWETPEAPLPTGAVGYTWVVAPAK